MCLADSTLYCKTYLFLIFFSEHGTCKHCVALLFALANFNDRHRDRHTLVGTDVECQWDKPKKSTEPMEVDKISLCMDPSSTDTAALRTARYRPMGKTDQNKNRNVEKQMFRLLKNTNAVLLHTLDPPSDESDDE